MQLMRNKLDPHWRNLSTVDMGKRIAGREAIEEKWIPLLDGKTRELWLQELVSKLKLWDRFMVFLNQRVEAVRAREKIEAISAKERASKRDICSICKSTSHSREKCDVAYCGECRISHRKGRHTEK